MLRRLCGATSMNHDRTSACNRLRGLALQFERGELDKEFTSAKVPIADLRATVAQRIRQLADAIESSEPMTVAADARRAG